MWNFWASFFFFFFPVQNPFSVQLKVSQLALKKKQNFKKHYQTYRKVALQLKKTQNFLFPEILRISCWHEA